MERYWITGISRGIGAALARELAGPRREIIGLSRTDNQDLRRKLTMAGAHYRHVSIDLVDSEGLRSRASEIFPPDEGATRLCLINNAAMTGKIAPVGNLGDSVEETVGLNTIALFVLCDLFAAAYQQTRTSKFVINVTSGAAQLALAGTALYTATKASVDAFTRVMAADQETREFPFQVVAVSPGMVETGMQETMRAQDPSVLPATDVFRAAKSDGKVQDPADAAAKLVRNLFDDRENGSIIHIRDLA